MPAPSSRQYRRPLGIMNSIATNYLHLRNPYVIAWWSAAFPGFAHISLGSYVAGFLLFTGDYRKSSIQSKLGYSLFLHWTF